jgi:predicted MFS family arabinose efflux permease
MPLALVALAIASFCIGTSEFVIMGLLPDVAKDLGVTIPVAGLLVTGYALGVVIGAPIVAERANRRCSGWSVRSSSATCCVLSRRTTRCYCSRGS